MMKKIGIVGFGQMGSGIAQVSAAAGYQVLAMDLAEQAFKRGLGYITKSLDKAIEKGKADQALKDKVLGNIKQAQMKREVTRVMINLYNDNEIALGCYLKAGFELVGTATHTMGLKMVRVIR